MKESNLSRETASRQLIMTIVFFAIFIIAIIFILWPKFKDLQSAQEKIEIKETEIQAQEKYLSDLNQVKIQLNNYQTELARIDSFLSGESSPYSFFNLLQRAASESGLIFEKISSFGVAQSEKISDLKENVIDFEVVGLYRSFKNFISILEKSARLIEVEKISFATKKGEEENKEMLSFNLKVKVYSY